MMYLVMSIILAAAAPAAPAVPAAATDQKAAATPKAEAAPKAAPDAKADTPPAPAKPAFEPTSNYTLQDVEGWKIYVHNRLLNEQKDLGEQALKELRMHLYHVTRRLPPRAVEKLRTVRIWVEADNPKVVCACYHPSRGWLEAHDFNPEKAKSIEIGNPKHFLDWTHHQFAMVLHELAHAYHHQFLGYDDPDIKAAYKQAMEAKLYDSVLLYKGTKTRAYAANNDQEYFAELTEAWFGTNDFYPFVRAEVKEHDPRMAEVLKKVWEK